MVLLQNGILEKEENNMSLNLDLTGAVEQKGTLPAAKYGCVVEKAEVVTTRSGGEMIKIQLKVTDIGSYFGRSIFDQFNFKNSNPQAVQIGLGQLKSFMRAAGHPNPNTLTTVTELQGLKVTVVTKIENDPQYGEQTRVKGYSTWAQPVANGVDTSVETTAPAANPFA